MVDYKSKEYLNKRWAQKRYI